MQMVEKWSKKSGQRKSYLGIERNLQHKSDVTGGIDAHFAHFGQPKSQKRRTKKRLPNGIRDSAQALV